MRSVCLFVMIGAGALASGSGLTQPASPGARLEELFALSRAQHPELAAMALEAEAARERITSAGALPDPMARVELRDLGNQAGGGNFNLLPGRVGSTRYSLTQSFPLWGKRGLRTEAASAEAAAAEARHLATWAELRARLRINFAQRYLASQSLALNAELETLAAQLEALAQARYAAGLTPQQDVLRAQFERSTLRSERVVLETEHHHARARLNLLLARPPGATVADPQALPELPPPARLEEALLLARIDAGNPQLAALAAQASAADTARELALRNRYPDLSVGLSPTQTGRRITEWELMFEVNIPLQQDSRRAQEREADALASAARARRDAARNELQAELAESLSALDAARRLVTILAHNLLPQAELALAAALAGYEGSRIDFVAVVEALRQLRKTRLDRLKAEAEAQLRLAQIERLLGVEP